MPNYRVPGQVAGSRMVSQLPDQPRRHHVRALPVQPPCLLHAHGQGDGQQHHVDQRQGRGNDKLAMLGVMLTLYYPALDKAWQKVTGNENAKVTRPGAASVPQAAIDLAKGDKGPAQEAAQSVFSPGRGQAPINYSMANICGAVSRLPTRRI